MRKIALFDQPLPHDTKQLAQGWVVNFTTPKGQKIIVTYFSDYMSTKEVRGETMVLDPKPVVFYMTFYNESQPQDPYGTTGTGEEIPIFSTVVKTTLEAFDKVRAREDGEITVKFDAKESEPGKIKLYHRLATGLARMRGGKVESGSHWNERHFEIIFPPKREVTMTPESEGW